MTASAICETRAIMATERLIADPSLDRRLFVISNEASYITGITVLVD